MNYSINVQRHGHLQREINSKKKSTKKALSFLIFKQKLISANEFCSKSEQLAVLSKKISP